LKAGALRDKHFGLADRRGKLTNSDQVSDKDQSTGGSLCYHNRAAAVKCAQGEKDGGVKPLQRHEKQIQESMAGMKASATLKKKPADLAALHTSNNPSEIVTGGEKLLCGPRCVGRNVGRLSLRELIELARANRVGAS
jgi:hypothetical protein